MRGAWRWAGRRAKEAYAAEGGFGEAEKYSRLLAALLNTMMMLRASISTQQWEEQQASQKK